MEIKHFTPHVMNSYRFGLIEPQYRDDVPSEWKVVCVAPTFLGQDTERCPILLELASLGVTDRAALLSSIDAQLTQGQSATIRFFIESDLPIEKLAKHLASRMTVNSEEANVPLQFRYFDPAIFLQLSDLFGGEGMSWLLGPIQSIAVIWATELGVFCRDTSSSVSSFKISNWLDDLLGLNVINRSALQLPPPKTQNEWILRCRRLATSLNKARQKYRLVNRDDLIQFVLHSELVHRRFDEHTIIQRIFNTLDSAKSEDELDYVELTNRVSKEDWMGIVHDLDRQMALEKNRIA